MVCRLLICWLRLWTMRSLLEEQSTHMRHRERAEARLERATFCFGRWESRQPSRRVVDRDVTPKDREILGMSVRTRDADVDIRRIRPVQFGPYAPLLKRVIRSPYALAVGRSMTIPGRQDVTFEDRHPAFRPHPFWRLRAAQGGWP